MDEISHRLRTPVLEPSDMTLNENLIFSGSFEFEQSKTSYW